MCTQCEPGKFADSSTGTTLCEDCPGGRFSGLGETSCSNCTKGTYSTDGKTCLACPAGTFGAEEGLDSPTCSGVCPPGTYSDNYASACLSCAPGKFAEVERSSKCISCQGDHFVSGEGARRCECEKKYYLDSLEHGADVKNGTSCKPCPTGASCVQGTTLATLSVDNGFWRASRASSEVIKCPYEAACAADKENAIDFNTSASCAEGYQGPVCGATTRTCTLEHVREHVRTSPTTLTHVSIASTTVAFIASTPNFALTIRRV